MDAEAALHIEIGENEYREPFTFSEKMDFSRMILEIERAKAKKRMAEGGKEAGRGRSGTKEKGTPNWAYPIGGETREIVAARRVSPIASATFDAPDAIFSRTTRF